MQLFHPKTRGFLMLSGGIEGDKQHKLVKQSTFFNKVLPQCKVSKTILTHTPHDLHTKTYGNPLNYIK